MKFVLVPLTLRFGYERVLAFVGQTPVPSAMLWLSHFSFWSGISLVFSMIAQTRERHETRLLR